MSSDKNSLLYPIIEPNQSGFLSVGQGHEIYWEECGNPKGFPIFFKHGGPGAGCDTDDRRFFDPDKWRIILHDQRGSNRSKPFGKIEANNTWALISDIWELRRHLGIDKMVLFGGSWGSTLSLAYSITYPRTVAGMVLRGIFLGERDEIDYLYNGQVALFRPDAWKRFAGCVPTKERHAIIPYIYSQLTSPNPETRKKIAYEMSFFEMSLLHLIPGSQEKTGKETNNFSFESMALMEAHYFVNNCFMPDRYILNNVHQIPNVPISLIQGEYDLVCPPISAYRLHKALPQSILNTVLAGHSSSDPAITKKLISETEAMFDKISR